MLYRHAVALQKHGLPEDTPAVLVQFNELLVQNPENE